MSLAAGQQRSSQRERVGEGGDEEGGEQVVGRVGAGHDDDGTSLTTASSSSHPGWQRRGPGRRSRVTPDNNSASVDVSQIRNKRCWICFEDEGDEEDNGSASRAGGSSQWMGQRGGRKEEWTHACRCTLVAHHSCLLTWITQSLATHPERTPQCPQCAHPYQLRQPSPLFLKTYNKLDRNLSRLVTPALVFVGGSAVLCASAVYGVWTVVQLLGEESAEQVLGDEDGWTWRTWLGLPLVAPVLIGTQLNLLDSALPLLPLIFFPPPKPIFTPIHGRHSLVASPLTALAAGQYRVSLPPSPQTWMCMLPWVRMLYKTLYAQIHFSLLGYTPLGGFMRRLRVNEQAMPDGEAGQGNGAQIDITLGATLGENPGEPGFGAPGGRPQTGLLATWTRDNEQTLMYTTGQSLGKIVVGALIMPSIANLMSGLIWALGSIKIGASDTKWRVDFSWIRRVLTGRFERSLVGIGLYIVLKDTISLYFKYQRLRQRRERRIVGRDFSGIDINGLDIK